MVKKNTWTILFVLVVITTLIVSPDSNWLEAEELIFHNQWFSHLTNIIQNTKQYPKG